MLRGGFRIARIFGINIYLDPSWIFIFLLVTWNLASVVLPGLHPNWSTSLNISMALLASLLFFASVLAHELSHSLVARAKGLPVGRITLFIFGGAADIGREPPSPGSEFLIAIIGPITSAVLGGLFLIFGALSMGADNLGSSLSGGLDSLNPLATLFFWLGPINILLAVFNMIPGFPLDGGRVLRSILWRLSRNLRLATRWASLFGQFIAWGFIITGAAMALGVQVPVFGSGLVGGLWLAFIGWFLNNAAVQSYRQVVVDELLAGVSVDRFMHVDTPLVEPDTRLDELVHTYLENQDSQAVAVIRDGRLLGVLQLKDARKVPKAKRSFTQVQEVMASVDELPLVFPGEEASEALSKLSRIGVPELPVVEDGTLVGMLRRQDILRWLKLQSDLV